ncbi:MAG: Gx transporter family protein [Oscillospiraceae bacterium]|jgi:heptaprenyl diphosphate synthase|nr:Gx transporter family protein [Oscillospiraceae bacterium]
MGRRGAGERTPAKRAALLGVLTAAALALGFAESFLVPMLPFGVKPGLSNIAVMLASTVLGWPAGLAIALAKAAFAGATRGLTAMLLSGAGGVCSALPVGILMQHKQKHPDVPLSEPGIGILGGVTHNFAQLLVARLLVGTPAVWGLAPLLIVAGAAAGAVTGMLMKLLRRSMKPAKKSQAPNAGKL